MLTTPFTLAAAATSHKATSARIITEGKIARKVIEAMLAAGYTVDVNDGEETTVKRSTSFDTIMAAMFSTDEDYLIARDSNGKVGSVYFVYGNDGHDVVNNYSTALEKIMAPVSEYAEGLA